MTLFEAQLDILLYESHHNEEMEFLLQISDFILSLESIELILTFFQLFLFLISCCKKTMRLS